MGKFVKWMSGAAAGIILEYISIWLMAFAVLQCCFLFELEIESSALLLVFVLLFGLVHAAGKIMGQTADGLMVGIALAGLLFLIPVFRNYRLVLGIALAGYLLLLLIHYVDWLRRICVLAGVAAAVTGFVMGKEFTRLLVGTLLLLVLKEVVSFWGRETGVRMLPFLLVFQFLILLIPTRSKPIDWSFVSRMGNSINQFCQVVMMETEYLMETWGFAGEGSGYGNISALSGSLVQTDREELYLGSKTTRGNLYITGRAYETFAKKQWEDTARDQVPQYAWYARYLNALYRNGITEEEAECFSRVCTNEFTYGYLKTRDVMHPSDALRLSADLAADFTGKIGDYTFEEPKGKDYSYRIDFMEFDYSNPYLIEVLRNCDELEKMNWVPYDILNNYSKEIYEMSLTSVISRREYYLYQIMLHHVEEETLDVSGISERTVQLAREITEHCDNDFDRAKQIETWLRQYEYSVETDLRDYEDFVDAFLFEEKKGYCTHYASAMVQMLRANDIPARLAQGYCCTYDNQPKGVKKVTIRGSAAHAWPEAYIRGYGWVRFEPTAVMETAESYGWNMLVKERKEGEGSLPDDLLYSEEGLKPEPVPEPQFMEGEQLEEELQEKQNQTKVLFWILLLPAAAIAALLMLSQTVKRIRYMRKNRFQRMEANLEDIKWLIRELYPGQWENRHLLEYAAVLAEPGHREVLRQISIRYYELRYKGGQPEAIEEIKVLSMREALYNEYLLLTGIQYWKRKMKAFFALESGRL